MKQTRQPLRAIKQSIYLDVYDVHIESKHALQGIACTRLFEAGLASSEGYQLKCFK
jgi:hypothetical protein